MSDVAMSTPAPTAAQIPSTVDLATMTRDEFIAAHKGRLTRPQGKQNYYVIPIDREPFLHHAHALPLMTRGKLRPGATVEAALGALYDETPRFGRACKDEQRTKDGQAAGMVLRERRAAALGFYSALDLDDLAQQFADLLGSPKSDNHRGWVEDLLVAAHSGKFCDHLRIENKKSKALFARIFGVKLPSTNTGTRQMLAQKAPWPLPSD